MERLQMPDEIELQEIEDDAEPSTDLPHGHDVNPAPALVAEPPAAAHVPKDPRMTPHHELGGIEILLQMAERGEIDPKNIDIIDVTDRFLKAVAAAPKENLRQSGKIIFQASVLLRLKAEALLAARVEEDLSMGDDYMDFDADGQPIIYDSMLNAVARQITLADLEKALIRQSTTRQMRHRRVTLEQLIEALRDAERVEKSRGERKVKAVIDLEGHHHIDGMDDILDLAHDEDIDAVIRRIEGLLTDLLASDDLLSIISVVEALGGRGDWVDAFLAVLFLSNSGKLALQQDEFYGPLYVVRAEVA
jgi:segregation and condensation protein A